MAKRIRKRKVVKRRRAASRASAANGRGARAGAIEAALAGIAHDIRTPLTGIVALAELLASSDLGVREREWANAVKSGADHLAGLATLIVDAAKTGANGLALRNEPFSPRELGESMGAALAARAGNKDIRARIEIAHDLPDVVSADLLRLRAALENLTDNAMKFTHEGIVTFTVAAEAAARNRVRLIFTVADSGIGMSADEVKHLFRPFAQASAEISRRYGGAGLGLSFVKRIANAMGGDLTVASRRGQGSTFRLTVPAKRVEARAVANSTDRRPVSVRPLSILVAEDNPYGRVVMNTILRELGHRVDFAETGEAAIAAVARGGYDAVLMDLTLSGLGGIEATQRIRTLPGSAGKTPIIGISGRSERGDEEAARAAGMNVYFMKPVSPAKLAQALAGLAG